MTNINLQTTKYDIFAYFIPGIIFIILTLIILINSNVGENTIKNFINFINDNQIPYWIIFIFIIIISYIIGMLLSTIGSLFIEKYGTNKISFLHDIASSKKWLSTNEGEIFKKDFAEIFNFNYRYEARGYLVIWCQKNCPEIFNTSFIYLVLYGFNRSLTVVFLLDFIFDILFVRLESLLVVLGNFILISCTLLSYRAYLHFRHYYIESLAIGFSIYNPIALKRFDKQDILIH